MPATSQLLLAGRRLFVLVLLLAGAGAVSAAPASAHAMLVAASPADGARLKQPPAAVTVTFDEPVGLDDVGYLHVVDQRGRTVDAAAASHPGGDGTKIRVPLRPRLGPGSYTASYRVISADSHPVTGAVSFVVGSGALVSAPPAAAVDRTTGLAFDVVRWLGFAGLVLLGGAWLAFTIWPAGRRDRRVWRLVATGWWLGVAGALGGLALEGPYGAGRGPTAVDGVLLDAALHTTFGRACAARLVLLGVLASLIGRRARAACAAVGVGLCVTYSLSGHADTHPLSVVSDSAHLIAMSLWVGGLVHLLVALLPRREPLELRGVLPVFSRVAFGCVSVLALTGTYQAWRGVGSLGNLTSTRYGQLVLAKVVLFAALLTVGNRSRRLVQRHFRPSFAEPVPVPPAGGGGGSSGSGSGSRSGTVTLARPAVAVTPRISVRALRRAVFLEVVIAATVLALTAVLVAEPPGRNAMVAGAARATMQLGGGRSATVTVDPGHAGLVAVRLQLDAGPAPLAVSATANLPAQKVGPIAIPLEQRPGLTYSASSVLLPTPGEWTLTVDVRTSEFDSVTADASLGLH
jgi:copper transport protein